MLQTVALLVGCGLLATTTGFLMDSFGGIRKDDPCGITGKWQNELNSIMNISCQEGTTVGSGKLTGTYKSAVGAAEDFYQLSGMYTMKEQELLLGWTVSYNNNVHGNTGSTASWTGRYFGSSSKTINTTWILTRYKPIADAWENSNIGPNYFTRVPIIPNVIGEIIG